MLKSLFTKVLGNRHERVAKKLRPMVDDINEIVEDLQPLSDEELRAQTEKLRALVRAQIADLETELAELRQTKRQTEDAEERAALGLEINRIEDALKKELQ